MAGESGMTARSERAEVLCAELEDRVTRRIACPAKSLVEAARFEPEIGIYTVDRTYPGERVLCMERHFDRLESSAAREGIPLRLDRPMVRSTLRDLSRESGFESVRFRISVAADRPAVVRISLERFQPVPDSDRLEGVRCSLMAVRRPHPESKTLGWMHHRSESPIPEGAYEGLIISPAREILEGYTSNFYAILGGTLRTAESGVLHGISRYVVLQVSAPRIPVALEPILESDLARCEETFLTSSTRGIIPIVAIDDRPIGSGQVGPRTRELTHAYGQWVDSHLEPLVPELG